MAKYTDIQKQFLSLLVSNKDLADDFLESSIGPSHFDPDYRRLIHAIEDSCEKDVLLTRKSYMDFISSLTGKNSEVAKEEVIFNSIAYLDVNRNDYPMLKGKIVENYLSEKSIDFIKKFNQDREANGHVHAIKMLASDMASLAQDASSGKGVVYEDVNNMSEEYLKWIDDVINDRIEKEQFVSTGFDELDKTSAVGIAPGTLTLFCGDVGGFKSTMMLNIAMNAWLESNKNVLFVPLEMPMNFIQHKMVSRQTRIPFDYVSNPKSLKPEQIEKIRKERQEVWKSKEGRMFVMDCYEQRASVGVIRRQIEQNIDIFKPDVVVIDYIANLQPDQRHHNRQDIEIGDMLKELFHMGRAGVLHDSGFGVVSGAQIGREALRRVRRQPGDRMQFHSEDIRGAHDYSADATCVYALMVDPQQPTEKLWCYCVKSRYGKKIFPDGQNKAVFDLKPEISLIMSGLKNDIYDGEEGLEILEKIDEEDSLDFDEDEKKKPKDPDDADDTDDLDDFLNL